MENICSEHADGGPRGRLFDIQRMSLHDGPGIRTTVFLKGCSMRCFWCHNPESWLSERELQYFADRCIGCGQCVGSCPQGCHSVAGGAHRFDRGNCTACGQCSGACPAGSLVYSGEDIDADTLVSRVMRDKPFYSRSGGGVTFSGGEPLLQPRFVREVFRRLHELGVDTAIETAAHVNYSAFEDVMPYTDHYLVDLKHPDSGAHRRATGVGNELIINNIVRLDSSGADYFIRIPLVPGVNDTTEDMRAFDAIFSRLRNLPKAELMPYHAMGLNKLLSLGRAIGGAGELRPPSGDKLSELSRYIRSVPVEYREN